MNKKHCDCNYCQLSRYTKETGDWNAAVAYCVAEVNDDIHLIEMMRRAGYTATHISDEENETGAELAVTLHNIDMSACLLNEALTHDIHPHIKHIAEGLIKRLIEFKGVNNAK